MKSNEDRQKAYELIVLQGYKQKEVAKILGVSEMSLSRWSKDHGWRTKRTELIYSADGIIDLMLDICKIKDNKLRDSIIDRLMRMIIPKMKDA